MIERGCEACGSWDIDLKTPLLTCNECKHDNYFPVVVLNISLESVYVTAIIMILIVIAYLIFM